MPRPLDYLYTVASIGFTVDDRIILKWRISSFGPLPVETVAKLRFLILLPFAPAIFSGFAAAFLASLAWIAAINKFDLSHAYPFMSLNFVVVLFLSGWLLNEPVILQNVLGTLLIVLGIVVAARG